MGGKLTKIDLKGNCCGQNGPVNSHDFISKQFECPIFGLFTASLEMFGGIFRHQATDFFMYLSLGRLLFAPLPLSLLDPSLGSFFGVWNPYLSVPFGGLFVIAHGVPIGVPLWGRISSFINYFVQTHLRSSNSLLGCSDFEK